MFDFPFKEATVGTAVFCLLIYLYITFSGKSVFVTSLGIHYERKYSKVLLYFWGFLMVIHCTNGDFFHLMETIKSFDFSIGAYHAQEKIYTDITYLVNRNYFLFRLIVFGGAFAAMLKFFKNEGINIYLGIWVYLVCYSILFAYARATLGMAIYFFGFSYLIAENKNVLSRVIGLLLIISSYQFHSSIIILIAITPFVFIPFNKRIVYIVLCCMPFIIIAVRILFSSVLNDAAMLDDEMIQRRLEYYADSMSDVGTMREKVVKYIQYTSLYLPFVVSLYYVMKKHAFDLIGKNQKRLFRYLFWLFIIVTALSWLNVEPNVFFYRVLFMTMIPSTAVLVYLTTNGFVPYRITRYVILFCFNYQFFTYVYMIYNNYVK